MLNDAAVYTSITHYLINTKFKYTFIVSSINAIILETWLVKKKKKNPWPENLCHCRLTSKVNSEQTK